MDIPQVSKNYVLRNLRGVENPNAAIRDVNLPKATDGNGLSVAEDNVVCATNPRGAVTVFDISEEPLAPVKGMLHSSGIVDIQHNPFHSDLFCTAGLGGDLMVSKVVRGEPALGIQCGWTDMAAHAKRIHAVAWNPLCDNILASMGADQTIKIWDLNGAQAAAGQMSTGAPHLWNLSFLENGKLLAGMGQDNVCRLFDPRQNSVAAQSAEPVFKSSKPSQCVAVATVNGVDPTAIICVGFEGMGKRMLKVLDVRDLSKPLVQSKFPGAGAQTTFHWISGNNLLFVSSKGDTRLSVLSVPSDPANIGALQDYVFAKQPGQAAFYPSHALDVMHTEIARCYNTELDSKSIKCTSFHCGGTERKFQEQYYKPFVAYTDPLPSDYWLGGGNGAPKYVEYRAKEGPQIELKPAAEATQLKWSENPVRRSSDAPSQRGSAVNRGSTAVASAAAAAPRSPGKSTVSATRAPRQSASPKAAGLTPAGTESRPSTDSTVTLRGSLDSAVGEISTRDSATTQAASSSTSSSPVSVRAADFIMDDPLEKSPVALSPPTPPPTEAAIPSGLDEPGTFAITDEPPRAGEAEADTKASSCYKCFCWW